MKYFVTDSDGKIYDQEFETYAEAESWAQNNFIANYCIVDDEDLG